MPSRAASRLLAGIGRKGVRIEVRQLGCERLLVGADGAERGERVGGCRLRQLRRGVLVGDGGLGAGIERRVASRRITLGLHIGAVVALLRVDERAVVERVHQRRGVAVGVRRSLQAGPLRPVGLVPGFEVLRQLRHLVGEVVHGDDLVAGRNRGRINLRPLLDLLEAWAICVGS